MKTCYVCGKDIMPRKIKASHYDPKHLDTFAAMFEDHLVRRADLPVYVGQDKYRHQKCEAGSAAWMKMQKHLPKRKRSEFYEVFKEVYDNDKAIRERTRVDTEQAES